ncbi:MAG: dTMP kinase [Puniceicoccales bacterium]|jgi:dTMP kinase|nr:dTMP kinase [Puniceicoccales bacterium]
MPGKIISFEGIEGTGKSTQIQHLQTFLASKNIDSIAIREPGNTYIGERIRHLLQHDPNAHNMCAETELLLFEASRAQLVRELILPAISKNTWVLCDRFFDSSTAYQGAARQLPEEMVQRLNLFVAGKCIPDFTILLDIDVDLALGRLQGRKKQRDRIEWESMEFFKRVREKYLQLAGEESARFFTIDATLPVEMIAEKICRGVEQRFAL